MSEEKKTLKWWRLFPNYLTLFRIAVVPILLVLYPLGIYWEISQIKVFCALLFAIAALTDWLDGYIARKYKLESKVGALLDPIADKMLTASALVLVASAQNLWAWMAGLLLCREIAISGLRLVALQHNFEIKVHFLAKIKTICLGVALTCLMVNYPLFGWPFEEVGMISIWLALVLSLISIWIYVKKLMDEIIF